MFFITILSRQLWSYVELEKGSSNNYWLPASMLNPPLLMKPNYHQMATLLRLSSQAHQRHMIC